MRKTLLFSILFVLVLIMGGSSLSSLLVPEVNSDEVIPTLAMASDKNTKISKTETEDYYLYNVEDYERKLIYSWKFAKDKNKRVSIEDSLKIDEDLRLSIDAHTRDTDIINQRVDQKKLIVTFDYHGMLPLETTVRINVANKFMNGEKLYLYYYNPDYDQMEYIEHELEVKDGYVEFQINHCSDYFLTAAVVNDAVNNPQSVNYVIILLVVVVFVLIALTLKQSGKK